MDPDSERPGNAEDKDGGLPDDFPDAIVVTTELDLHGLYPEQVPPMLEDFIRNAAEKGYPEVKIVHGKGRSTMKRIVLEFLEKHPLVESFRDAWDSGSGWGATVVKIKS
ncbi:MAG: Smr/MutS family protein [Candidatus Eisenbacteria sp.]|nr:Smr/MutS family protein [Candidatus Eisenbacteria bacterium]